MTRRLKSSGGLVLALAIIGSKNTISYISASLWLLPFCSCWNLFKAVTNPLVTRGLGAASPLGGATGGVGTVLPPKSSTSELVISLPSGGSGAAPLAGVVWVLPLPPGPLNNSFSVDACISMLYGITPRICPELTLFCGQTHSQLYSVRLLETLNLMPVN